LIGHIDKTNPVRLLDEKAEDHGMIWDAGR